MKIGILTHYFHSLNYGGMLQAYALARYLNQKGYKAEQISYAYSSDPFIPRQGQGTIRQQEIQKNLLIKVCKRIYRSLKYRLFDKQCEKYYAGYKQTVIPKRAVKFSAFQEQVPHSKTICDPQSVDEVIKEYDFLITGSDQVWNFTWFNPAFFLDFRDCSAKKIAYAASTGKTEFCEKEEQYLKRTLAGFDAISVREFDMAEKLNNMLQTDSVEQTIDPTLLLNVDKWDEIASPRLLRDKYLFCYFLHNNRELSKLARRFARKHHLHIAMIPFPGIEYNVSDIMMCAKYRFHEADPSDFISLIKHAEYVFTDSFHATVFSLLYEKQFVSFPRDDAKGMTSRLSTLAALFDCEERVCSSDARRSLDYIDALPEYRQRSAEMPVERARQRSIAFLSRALGSNSKGIGSCYARDFCDHPGI